MPIVAVTGGTGLLAGALIKQLIERGYLVRATVRDLHSDRASTLLAAFPKKLRLFQAQLLDKPEVYAKCFEGCQCVFHLASPFVFVYEDPQKEIVDPAVIGTTTVVTQALSSASVTRIVLNSSVSTIIGDKDPSYVYNEIDMNTTATVQDAPFPLSKILSEKVASELVSAKRAQGSQASLVIINAGFMLGAPATKTPRGVSIQTITALMSGLLQSGARPVRYLMADVADVALAHIAACERKEAAGRYIVSSSQSYSMLDVANILQKYFPFCILPTMTTDASLMNPPASVDNSRVTRELGVAITPLEATVKAMGMALIRLGFLRGISNIKARAPRGSPHESDDEESANPTIDPTWAQ